MIFHAISFFVNKFFFAKIETDVTSLYHYVMFIFSKKPVSVASSAISFNNMYNLHLFILKISTDQMPILLIS